MVLFWKTVFFLQLPLNTRSFPLLHFLRSGFGVLPCAVAELHPRLQWLHIPVGELMYGLVRAFWLG